jgi:hypothetical protein
MLSGLLAPPEPEADSGGFAIDAVLSCGVVFPVCANAAVPLVAASASAMLAASLVSLLRFISSSFAIPPAGFAAFAYVVIDLRAC